MAEYTCPKCNNVEEGFVRTIEAEVEQVLVYYDSEEELALEEEYVTDLKKVISMKCRKCNYEGEQSEFINKETQNAALIKALRSLKSELIDEALDKGWQPKDFRKALGVALDGVDGEDLRQMYCGDSSEIYEMIMGEADDRVADFIG